MKMRAAATRETSVAKVSRGQMRSGEIDVLAMEEPLEIQLGCLDEIRWRTLSVTMRTPGADRELTAGFLYTEGIISAPEQLVHLLDHRTTVRIELRSDAAIDWELECHFVTASSCGIRGKTSIAAVQQRLWAPLSEAVAERSNTPASKSAIITLSRRQA